MAACVIDSQTQRVSLPAVILRTVKASKINGRLLALESCYLLDDPGEIGTDTTLQGDQYGVYFQCISDCVGRCYVERQATQSG